MFLSCLFVDTLRYVRMNSNALGVIHRGSRRLRSLIEHAAFEYLAQVMPALTHQGRVDPYRTSLDVVR